MVAEHADARQKGVYMLGFMEAHSKQGLRCAVVVRLRGAVVRALDLRSTGRGFDSPPPHCRAATLGQLFIYVPSVSEFTTV